MRHIANIFRSHQWRPIILAVLGVLIGGLIIGNIWTVVAIRSTQVDGQDRADDTNRAAKASETVLKQIRDCTTPGEPCYEAGADRRLQSEARIQSGATLAATFAAACADQEGVQGAAEIYKCTILLIKEAEQEPRK